MTDITVLVTGGAGFIGSHTVDKLLKNNYKVVILDNFSTGRIDNLPANHPNLTIIKGNICNLIDCEKASKKCDYVIHLAAEVSVVKTIENPKSSFDNNLLGFVNILETVRKNKNIRKIIFSSSAAIYGDNQKLPLQEKDIKNNILSPYALEKATAEEYLKLYKKLYDIKYTILRYFNVYGKRQDPKSAYSGVISKFINFYKNNHTFQIYGDGTQTRDFINVKDVAQANILSITKGDNKTYNIATGTESSILDLVEIFKKISPQKDISVIHHKERSGDIKFSKASTVLAQKELGLNCKHNLSSITELIT